MQANTHDSLYDCAVIGGGAGGMTAAIALHRLGQRVVVLEANDRVGKKLLASGNGRCNLTNTELSARHYNRPDFVAPILARYGTRQIVAYFYELGLLTRTENGRVYPYSIRATNVLNVLLRALQDVRVECNATVTRIEQAGDAFRLICNDAAYRARRVILASGSDATFGRRSHGLYAPFGHRCTDTAPSICAMRCKDIVGAQGVRTQAAMRVRADGLEIAAAQGELLFKDDQLSGMLAFEISSQCARAARQGKALDGEIDFVPDLDEKELERFLLHCDDALQPLRGVLQSAIARNVIGSCPTDRSLLMSPAKARSIAHACKHYGVRLEMPDSVANAQALCGGLECDDFDPNTLQSKRCAGLWAIGESLDVDGDCGGYNLHWAWASGLAAAQAIGEMRRAR